MHYTVANWLFDEVMPSTNGSVYKVVSAVARVTAGWKRQWSRDALSFTDFEDLTGMVRDSVGNGLREALDSGYIIRKKSGRSFIYSLSIEVPNSTDFGLIDSTEIGLDENEQSENPTDNQSEKRTDSSPKNVPITGDTFYKKNKEKREENTPPTPQTADEPENPFPFQPLRTRSAVQSPADDRKDAIISVCGLDPSIPAHVKEAESAAAQLAKYTAAFILDRYGPGGWWYFNDWRGQKGQQPTPRNVVETISKTTQTALNGHAGQSLDDILNSIQLESSNHGL